MQKILSEYIKEWNNYISGYVPIQSKLEEALNIIKNANRIFWIGNGGSQSICSHMSEDWSKMAQIPSLSLESSAYLTMLSNDYGFENIYDQWLYQQGFDIDDDCLIAISSSGNSTNIINALKRVQHYSNKVIGLSAFSSTNEMSKLKLPLHFHVPVQSYGIAEIIHLTILHILLDMYIDIYGNTYGDIPKL